MSIIDIIILAVLVAFALLGFKRGLFQSLVSFVGFLVIVALSYWLKNYLGDFLVLNLPFTKYTFIPGGSYVLNIVTYETIAFLITLVVLGIIYKIVLIVSGIFEKLLKLTIILGIPSKILGLIIGAIEGYVIVYLVLFLITQPFIRIDVIENSKYAEKILKDTPVLSRFTEDTFEIISEIDITVKKGNEDNFDLKLADLILKRHITSVEIMQELIDEKKLSISGLQDVVDNYKVVESISE